VLEEAGGKPSYILNVLGDRMEMAHSIEGRVPFLDHHVVELARSLPVLDKVPAMDVESQSALDNVFIGMLGACVLQERSGLSS